MCLLRPYHSLPIALGLALLTAPFGAVPGRAEPVPAPTEQAQPEQAPAQQASAQQARTKQEKAQQQAVQLANRLRSIALRGWVLPEEADAADPRVRLLLLLPGGPVVMIASVTIDGRPFRSHREALVSEAMSAADQDGDGRVTWSELAAHPVASRYRQALANNSAAFTLDADEFVSAREMRHLLAMLNGGAGLSIGPAYAGSAVGNMPLFEVLDADDDRRLSEGEIERAVERIRSRDADDNELVAQSELGGSRPYGYRVRIRGATPAGPHFLRHLDGSTDWAGLLDELRARYGREGKLSPASFESTPQLFARLDANGDRRLAPDELKGLLELSPHLELRVELGEASKVGEEEAGGKDRREAIQVTHVDPNLQLTDQVLVKSDGELLLVFSETLVRVHVQPLPDYARSYDAQAKNLVRRYDKNKNGYVEKEEVEAARALGEQFDQWDADGDGMVYEAEIRDFYRRQQEPRRHQTSIAASERAAPLFTALDTDRDNHLGLRELNHVVARLRSVDRNGDGSLERGEIPRTIHLAFSRGNYAYQGVQRLVRPRMTSRKPGDSEDSPAWFQSMDRNRDGDVSRREFLGTSEQFARLDQDGDGLVSAEEAVR